MKCPLIYALSSEVDQKEINKSGEVGFIGYIQNPLTKDKVKQILDSMMKSFAMTWIENQMSNMDLKPVCIWRMMDLEKQDIQKSVTVRDEDDQKDKNKI